jgi:peptidoglycan hydrolase-like protein with peptidoglycan-binding domain
MNTKIIFTVLLLTGALAFSVASVWSQDMPTKERTAPAAPGGQKLSEDEIKNVQQALKEKGHDPGAIDGKMSRQTVSAITAFQKASGLKSTGQLDEQTLKALGVEKGGKAPGGGVPGTGKSPSEKVK